MGRKPIIREAILRVLKNSHYPLRFNQIKREVAEELNRRPEEVRDQNISDNLSILVENGQVEKTSISGKNAYSLSNSFYKSKNKTLIKSIIASADLKDFYPRFEDRTNPPLTAYFENLESLIDPEQTKAVRYFSTGLLNWSDPLDLTNRRMLEAFTDLEVDERKGIKKLLAYAYWYGVQSLVKNFGLGPLNEVLSNNKDFAVKCIENAKERRDSKRIEAEKVLIQILNITEEILSKKNLDELLIFFQKQNLEIKKLQNRLLSLTGEFMGAGEKIFDSFLEFHNCALIGLQAAELIPRARMRGYGFPRYRYLLNYGDVWDKIIFSIISQFNFEELKSVNGNLEQTLAKIKEHKKHLWSLMALPFRSRMLVVYLWGYPEIFEVSDKEFLPMFAEWFSALKAGYLDHRSWIFGKKAITTVINALKAVRRGKAPPDGITDLEPWTIKDLYQFHPRGKGIDFWEELLMELNIRMHRKPRKRELCRHITAALEGRY